MKSKLLNVAAILLCIVAAWSIFEGIWALVATEGYTKSWAEMMGETVVQSPVLTMAVQFFGVYKLIGFAFIAIVALIPLRKAERWAWFSILILGGISAVFGIILWAPYAPLVYLLVLLLIAALVLSAIPIFGKK